MENEFVPYELAVKLKALGFDEPCFAFYRLGKEFYIKGQYKNTELAPSIGPTVPTYSQAFRWFREEHGLYTSIVPKRSYPDGYVSGIEWVVNICGGNGDDIGPDGVFPFPEAELACLDKLLEIVEQEKK